MDVLHDGSSKGDMKSLFLPLLPSLGEKEIEKKNVELVCVASSSPPYSLLRKEDPNYQIAKLCSLARPKAVGSVWGGNNSLSNWNWDNVATLPLQVPLWSLIPPSFLVFLALNSSGGTQVMQIPAEC